MLFRSMSLSTKVQEGTGAKMYRWAQALFPIHRSITGAGKITRRRKPAAGVHRPRVPGPGLTACHQQRPGADARPARSPLAGGDGGGVTASKQ